MGQRVVKRDTMHSPCRSAWAVSAPNPRSNPRSCWSGRGELAYSCETTALGDGVRVLWTLPTPIGSHNSQRLAL